jgi:hypothetical protein
VQTFLPEDSFELSARRLDDKRLGKQRVECKQILKALRGETKGWRNHPATLMWYGYEGALMYYMDCMIREWRQRGFRNKMPLNYQWSSHGPGGFPVARNKVIWRPHWHGTHLINTHRSNLLRKDPEFYGRYGWDVPADLPYHWPVTKEEVEMKRVLELCP